ncbi:MAG: HAD family hydrolase [Candidatus Kapabacteria bacterium]|nr:HAD family hydrolase [Candidatus Kapabacteria bacterium]
MKLIIFDIDGTLLNTTSIDDGCLLRTFKDLYSIIITEDEWVELKNQTTGTDIELSRLIFKTKFNRDPDSKEIEKIKKHFHQLLIFSFESQKEAFTEIQGAKEIFNDLINKDDFVVGISTGSWKLSAMIKLRKINIIPNGIPFSHADKFSSRIDIVKDTIYQAKLKHKTDKFDKIFYVGDGIWDFKTTKEIGIDFIGIDSNGNDLLNKMGASVVLENFADKDLFFSYIS